MDWDDVRHFLALARTGSVRAAGATLSVSHSTVARRVEGLEARLSTRLFDRTREGYTLTCAGREMLPSAERVEQEIARIERDLAGGDTRMEGEVAVTCCDAWVSAILVPALADLCEAHRGLEVALCNDARPFDLSKREADLALRVLATGTQPPEHLIGRPLVPVTVCSYVAVAHAERLSPAGEQARWLGFDDRRIAERMVASTSHPDVPLWGSFGSIDTILQAAHAGLGWAMLPTYVGDLVPGLRRLEQPDLRHFADLWLLCHPDLRDNARVRATRMRVEAAIMAHAARFHGERPMDGTERSAGAPSAERPHPVG